MILVGDCRELMRGMAPESVDAIVTDPPYEIGFMGKSWDSTGVAFDVVTWREALRVLKPGGHLLAFSGSRTYHRMACAIEDAGFEIRDQIMWLYGSGFPKSLDVSKAIDKARAEDVEPIRVVCRAVRAAMDALGLKSHQLVGHFGDCNPRLIDHWAARDTDSQPSMPTLEQWAALRGLFPALAAHDDEVWRLNGRKGSAGDAWANAEILGVHEGTLPGLGGERFGATDKTIREPSEAARQWQGWGTALKPAHEPIVVARKPIRGTVAANVLAHGVGALNIDGCRIPMSRSDAEAIEGMGGFGRSGYQRKKTDETFMQGTPEASQSVAHSAGRWPANVIHDGSDEVLAAFPDAPGQLAAASSSSSSRKDQNVYGAMARGSGGAEPRADSGSAARFFYCAKASQADRDAGLGGQEVEYDHSGPRGHAMNGDGTPRPRPRPRSNTHPTVKPTDLMRYLVRLVTPPGGTVLDPFTGSGSTGRGAILEGFQFIGCELDPENVRISHARIAAAVIERAEDLERIRMETAQGALF